MIRLLFIVLMAFVFKDSFSQSRPLFIGTIEKNLVDWEEWPKDWRYIGVGLFQKIDNNWESADININKLDTFKVNVIHLEKNVKTISLSLDTQSRRLAFIENSYRISPSNLKHFGKMTTKFSGWTGEKKYEPLLVTTSNFYKKNSSIKTSKANFKDSIAILKYLIDEAAKIGLGKIPTKRKSLIQKMLTTIKINDTCKFISANINLNMYCYRDSITFERDTTALQNGDEVIWFNWEMQNASTEQLTRNSWFFVNGNKVSFVSQNLIFFDNGDFDNDGYDEIIFKFEKYNHDGYIMLCDKFQKIISSGWSYH